MPHRVANFLRTSSGNIQHITKHVVSPGSSRNTSRTTSPYASDSDDHPHPHHLRKTELGEASKKHHRLSFPFSKGHKDHSSSSSLSLDWEIESPPVCLYGNSEDSTGALVSGQMRLEVKTDILDLDNFRAALNIHVTQKRPFQGHCHDCQHQYTELRSWVFIDKPTTLTRGRHLYPFSVLLDGHLPATTETTLMSIAYEFKAEAYVARSPSASSASCAPLKFERPLFVGRALPENPMPHHSVRVFPPTNIKASARYMSSVYPSRAPDPDPLAPNPTKVEFNLDGLVTYNEVAKKLDVWKLKKVTWRLEETTKTIAPPCPKHAPVGDAPNRNGAARRDIRILGEKQIHSGWKTDYNGRDMSVSLEFDYAIKLLKSNGRDLKYACDTKTNDGTEISHALVVELVVSKEQAPEGRPEVSAQTGTGRILRMHYAVTLSRDPGTGVSWDNEAPPIYQEVPPSPPAYPTEDPIDYEDLQPLEAQRSSVEGRVTPPSPD